MSGTLARTNALGGATAFPAEISVPDEMSRDSLRLGMSGNATAFAGNAGVIGLLASILVWISRAYLGMRLCSMLQGKIAAATFCVFGYRLDRNQNNSAR